MKSYFGSNTTVFFILRSRNSSSFRRQRADFYFKIKNVKFLQKTDFSFEDREC